MTRGSCFALCRVVSADVVEHKQAPSTKHQGDMLVFSSRLLLPSRRCCNVIAHVADSLCAKQRGPPSACSLHHHAQPRRAPCDWPPRRFHVYLATAEYGSATPLRVSVSVQHPPRSLEESFVRPHSTLDTAIVDTHPHHSRPPCGFSPVASCHHSDRLTAAGHRHFALDPWRSRPTKFSVWVIARFKACLLQRSPTALVTHS